MSGPPTALPPIRPAPPTAWLKMPMEPVRLAVEPVTSKRTDWAVALPPMPAPEPAPPIATAPKLPRSIDSVPLLITRTDTVPPVALPPEMFLSALADCPPRLKAVTRVWPAAKVPPSTRIVALPPMPAPPVPPSAEESAPKPPRAKKLTPLVGNVSVPPCAAINSSVPPRPRPPIPSPPAVVAPIPATSMMWKPSPMTFWRVRRLPVPLALIRPVPPIPSPPSWDCEKPPKPSARISAVASVMLPPPSAST